MATKLLRKIAPSTPLQHSGRLLSFNRNCLGRELNKGALDFGSNRQWRRIEKAVSVQVLQLSFYELNNTLIAPNEREQVYDDFDTLVIRYGEAEALAELRRLIVDNHLWTELLRVSMDFTCVKSKRPEYAFDESREVRRATKQGKTKEQLTSKKQAQDRKTTKHDWQGLKVTNLAMRSVLRSPNAPNTLPALSLAAA